MLLWHLILVGNVQDTLSCRPMSKKWISHQDLASTTNFVPIFFFFNWVDSNEISSLFNLYVVLRKMLFAPLYYSISCPVWTAWWPRVSLESGEARPDSLISQHISRTEWSKQNAPALCSAVLLFPTCPCTQLIYRRMFKPHHVHVCIMKTSLSGKFYL